MRDRMKDEHYFIILSQKERKNIIMFEDAVKKTTLEKGELDRGTRNGYSILIKLDIENPIIRINTAFKGCSSLEKISVLPRIYHN